MGWKSVFGMPPRAPGALPPAGWHQDPYNPQNLRYWDGQQWTEHTWPLTQEAAASEPPGQAVAVPEVVIDLDPTVEEIAILDLSPTPEPSGIPVIRLEQPVVTGPQPSIEQLVASLRREAPRHPLDEQVEVVGETYYVKGIKNVFRDLHRQITPRGSTIEECECILVPEPWNEFDLNAVAVAVGPHQVGYLPAELAAEYAPGLNRLAQSGTLATGTARIWAKADSGVVRARVTILVPEAHRFG